MQKTILKKQYENFAASRSEGLDKTYDRFQKLITQLEIHGEVISQDDANLKLMRSLPPAWNNHTLIMRNKFDIDMLSMDDLYNNLKVYEAEIQGQSSSSSNSQNVAFVSSDNTSSTNEVVNITHNVSTASSQGQASASTYVDDVMFSLFANQSNSPQLVNEYLEQIDTDDLEEMNLKWAPRNQGNRNGDNTRRVVPVETLANALVHPAHIPRDLNDIHMNKSDVFESASDSSVNESEDDNNQVNDRYKAGEGYHAVPPPYTGNLMPPRPDLSFVGLDDFIFKSVISETVTSVHETKTSASKSSKESMEKPKIVRYSAPLIEDWESDSDDDCEIRPSIKQNKPSHAKINFFKSDENTKKSIIKQHTYRQAKNLRKSQNSKFDKRN
nr:hypothetical protein [Tanacetum cinerariifolium]